MKKLLFWALVASTILLVVVTDHPMQMLLNFLVGGVVPGVNISLGFIPSIAVIVFLMWALILGAQSLHHQSLEKRTVLNKLHNEMEDFTQSNSGENARKRDSIVIAPSAKQA